MAWSSLVRSAAFLKVHLKPVRPNVTSSSRCLVGPTSRFFHCAEEWVLVLTCIGRDLSDLSFSDLEREHAAHAFALGMNLQHNARRRRSIHTENMLQHVHDELHRSVIVV